MWDLGSLARHKERGSIGRRVGGVYVQADYALYRKEGNYGHV